MAHFMLFYSKHHAFAFHINNSEEAMYEISITFVTRHIIFVDFFMGSIR